MAGAVIGALRVALGLDSAQFSAGLKSANDGLSKFAKSAAIGLAAVATAGAALAVAVKGSIDRADDLSKTAQRIGTTTEALSRLEWAAKLSDVSLEQLSTGLQRLSRNMFDVSNGAGAQAKTAFAALGISVTDASGKLRSSDEVFADIADRFSRMPDGAEKTALAMQLFGRAGAEMIPLLDAGRDGLAEMAEESDRLGNTISTKTGKAAEAFNDSITRLQAGLQGMVNRIAEAALPTLNNLIDTLTSPDFMQAMQDFAIAAIAIADGIAQVFIGAHKAFSDFLSLINSKGAVGAAAASNQDLDARIEAKLAEIESAKNGRTGLATAGGISWRIEVLEGQLATLQAERNARGDTVPLDVNGIFAGLGGQTFDSPEAMFESMRAGAGETSDVIDRLREFFDGLGASGGRAAAGVNALKQAMAEGKAVFDATRTPAEAYALEVERLNALLQKGAIDQDTYNRAVAQAQDAFQQARLSSNQLATSLADGLGDVFWSIVDGSKSAIDAVGDLLKSLAKMATNQLFQSLAGGLFGGGGGLGGFLGGLVPGFANGTNFAPGGLAMVGERGPELVNLPRGSQVIPNSELGSPQRHVVIQQSFPIQGAISDKTVLAMVQQGAASAVDAVKQQLPEWQASLQTHGAL